MRARSLLLLCLLLAVAVSASADFSTEFRAGVQAADQKNWAQCLRHMQSAMATHPEDSPARILIAGERYVPYVPNYYAGLALTNLGDCKRALEALSIAERRGIAAASSNERSRELARAKAICADQPSPAPAADASSPSPATSVPAPPQPPLATPAELAASSGRAVEEARRGALRDISNAERLRAELAGLRAQQGREVWASNDSLHKRMASGDSQLQRSRALMRKAQDGVGETHTEAATLKQWQESSRAARAAIEEYRELQRRLEAAVAAGRRALEPVVAPAPPEILVNAAAAFFRGDYAGTVQVTARRPVDRRSAAYVSLFRSAAMYALYVIEGERDATQRVAIEQEIRSCRALDPAVAPGPREFSPRFRSFFERVAGSSSR